MCVCVCVFASPIHLTPFPSSPIHTCSTRLQIRQVVIKSVPCDSIKQGNAALREAKVSTLPQISSSWDVFWSTARRPHCDEGEGSGGGEREDEGGEERGWEKGERERG